jgi:hypothetical protein
MLTKRPQILAADEVSTITDSRLTFLLISGNFQKGAHTRGVAVFQANGYMTD